MFYLGTWKLGELGPKEIEDVIKYSVDIGVTAFDTAAVYGQGRVEAALGSFKKNDLKIVTKLPAKTKPNLNDDRNIAELYPYEHVDCVINQSMERLGNKRVHAILLHNWCYGWETKYEKEATRLLNYIKSKNIADMVGISLPNGYDNKNLHLSPVMNKVDILECAYNDENNYIRINFSRLKTKTGEIILRSFLKDIEPKAVTEVLEDRIRFCIKNNLSFTIGSTNKEHIRDNYQLIIKNITR